MDRQFLIDVLRNARGLGQAGRAIVQPMIGDIPAGLTGLGQMMLTGDMDKAAEATRGVQEKFAYTPDTEEGQGYLAGLGRGIEAAGEQVKRIPGAAAAGQAAGQGWEGLANASPASAAILAGVAGVADPTKGGGKAARRVPRAIEELGTAKAAREAETAATLAEQAGQTFEETGEVSRRAAEDARKYRAMYEDQGLDAVMADVKAGGHLRPAPGGGWTGAPRTVKTEAQLQALRQGLDDQFNFAIEGLQYADPERLGDWYERAKRGQAASNEPWQLPRSLEQHAVYSAGVAPESELAFALKHRNQEALGTGARAYREAGKSTLDEAVAGNVPAELAAKVGEYRGKNDPRRVEESPFGVNDFRMAQAYGYTDPQGNPWTAGVSATMHPFMDAETALAVSRANEAGFGGRTNWTGAQVQELPWILNKADDIYRRGSGSSEGRFHASQFGGDEVAGKVAALREANKTIEDFFPKHTLSATYEMTPGANTGHRADVLEMPFEERARYGEQGRWDQPAPENAAGFGIDTPFGEVGGGNRDVLYGAVGFRQLPTLDSVGNYTNEAGITEQNPLKIGRPLMDFATGTQQQINPDTMATVRALEMFRGVNDAQEAVAAHLPVTMAGRTGKTGILLDRGGGAPPTREEMDAVNQALVGTPFEGAASASDRGVSLFNFNEKPPTPLKGKKQGPPKPATPDENVRYQQGLMRDALRNPALANALPGATPEAAAFESTYEPAMSRSGEAGQGIATTRALEAFAAAPEEAALRVGESEAVRRALRGKVARDTGVPTTREDIQKMRQFFSEADWPRAVAMMRKGMKPAAALAAMGYSLQGMAAENE